MKRFFGPFIVALLVLIAGFFITSLSMASYDDHSLADEWRSWLPAEEAIETEESNEEITLPGQDLEIAV